MIDADTFVRAQPREVAAQLGGDIHLWRLPWRRALGRAPLLDVLAAYLHVDASTLTLEKSATGKPRLRGEDALHFNWSHSGEFALIALSRKLDVGVDIEQPRPGVRILEIAQRFFAGAETQTLALCDESQRERAFLKLWCAKEAVLKALGVGLAFGLERVEFACSGHGWQPSRFDAEAGAISEWHVLSLDAARGYAGALAWRGGPAAVHAWSRSLVSSNP